MSIYTIGEVADRSGFTASALRYYEGIGLLSPASRTDAGYRIYDDHTLARLAFITRAKRLGCSLDEITDLVGIRDGERCGPVQTRFHELVDAKIADAQRQIAELAAFTAQLQTAATQLSGQPIDGPCGPDCACITDAPSAPQPSVVEPLTTKPDGETPIACTLDADSIPDRRADWRAILVHASGRTTAADGTLRVEFANDIELAELAQLVAAEQRCCAFFSFAITIDARGTALEVRAPDGATETVSSLFGAAS